MTVAAPLLVFAALLVLSGLEKAARPLTAATALHRAGVPAARAAARFVAALELAVGGAVLLGGGRVPGGALATLYGGFLLFLLWRRSAGDLHAPCGCFGASEAPLGPAHLVVDVLGAAVGGLAAVLDPPGMVTLADEGTFVAVATGALAALGAVQLRLVLTSLAAIRTGAPRAVAR